MALDLMEEMANSGSYDRILHGILLMPPLDKLQESRWYPIASVVFGKLSFLLYATEFVLSLFPDDWLRACFRIVMGLFHSNLTEGCINRMLNMCEVSFMSKWVETVVQP